MLVMRRASTSLLIGFFVNVLIAWACAIWSPIDPASWPYVGEHGEMPPLIVGPNGLPGYWMISYGTGITIWCPVQWKEWDWAYYLDGPDSPITIDAG